MPTSSGLFPDAENYIALFNGLKQRIRSAQVKVAIAELEDSKGKR